MAKVHNTALHWGNCCYGASMPFEPDILVQNPDGTMLVVEVKSRGTTSPAPTDLTRYMAGMRIPLGMLVSPESIVLYRDTYAGPAETSIKTLGTYPTEGLFAFEPQTVERQASDSAAGASFEVAVQRWLEGLATGAGVAALPVELRKAVEKEILPSLREGEIRAAGPRWQRTGS